VVNLINTVEFMAEQSLKDKTIKGVAWNGIENFSDIGIRFVFGIILARILGPSDYGIIGILTVFLAVSDTIMQSGFGVALIRKVDRTETDNATVFYFNVVVGILMYGILFLCAPLIAGYFKMDILQPVLRVLALSLIINSFSVVQLALLNARLDFKTSAKITLISGVISSVVGVAFAYFGYGVWSLVYQTLSLSLVKTVLMWIWAKWRPRSKFSWESFRELFSFGSKLLLAGLIDTLYNNIYNLVIGKLFTPATLGYYTRAHNYAMLPSSTLNGVVQRVSLPVLSTIQEDKERLAVDYRKILKMTAFITFPCMMLLFGVSDPLIRWMLTDKWEGCIVLLQILCFSLIWIPIHSMNLNLLKVMGRSDLFLRLEIIKKGIGILVLIITYRWGVEAMCYGGVFSSLIGLVINSYYNGVIIKVGFLEQMKDVLPIFLLSLLAGVLAYYVVKIPSDFELVKLILGTLAFGIIYLGGSYIAKVGELIEFVNIVKGIRKR